MGARLHDVPTMMGTVSGRFVDLVAPDWRAIHFTDIAHHLAGINRWTGARYRQVSVLEHSLRCAELAPADLRLEALLHDAHEAYCGDISRPMLAAIAHLGGEPSRHAVGAIKFKLDIAIMRALLDQTGVATPLAYEHEAFGLARGLSQPGVKAADDAALREEAARDDPAEPVPSLAYMRVTWVGNVLDECRRRYA